MNYKTCYHSRHRNRYYRRRRSLSRIVNATNTLILLFCITFIGVLVANAATLSDNKCSSQDVKYAYEEEITITRISQVFNSMETLEKESVKSDPSPEPTPLVLNEPIVIGQDITEENKEEVVEVVDRTIDEFIGEKDFEFNGNMFHGYDMPNIYYPGIDYSFEPYMDYKCITNKSSPAYAVSHSENAYTDEYGLRRYVTSDDKFKINGQDDYIIALGTYYKPKGECGSRYLIVTTTGMFTIITGDEKADRDTDDRNMFSVHKDGSCACIVEWIVDTSCLETTMRRAGTITAGPVEALKGEITHIYRIESVE